MSKDEKAQKAFLEDLRSVLLKHCVTIGVYDFGDGNSDLEIHFSVGDNGQIDFDWDYDYVDVDAIDKKLKEY